MTVSVSMYVGNGTGTCIVLMYCTIYLLLVICIYTKILFYGSQYATVFYGSNTVWIIIFILFMYMKIIRT